MRLLRQPDESSGGSADRSGKPADGPPEHKGLMRWFGDLLPGPHHHTDGTKYLPAGQPEQLGALDINEQGGPPPESWQPEGEFQQPWLRLCNEIGFRPLERDERDALRRDRRPGYLLTINQGDDRPITVAVPERGFWYQLWDFRTDETREPAQQAAGAYYARHDRQLAELTDPATGTGVDGEVLRTLLDGHTSDGARLEAYARIPPAAQPRVIQAVAQEVAEHLNLATMPGTAETHPEETSVRMTHRTAVDSLLHTARQAGFASDLQQALSGQPAGRRPLARGWPDALLAVRERVL